MSDTKTESNGKWTFDCNKCDFRRDYDFEADALNAAAHHSDYGAGHWDFEITDPDGEVEYP